MKFILLALIAFNTHAFAQTNQLEKAITAKEKGKLKKAKKLIDSVITHTETANDYAAWANHGAIYLEIYTSKKKKFKKLEANPELISFKSLEKSKTLERNDSPVIHADTLLYRLARELMQSGMNAFEEENYEQSFQQFEFAIKCSELSGKIDSMSYMNVAIASARTADHGRTIEWYEKSIALGYQEASCCNYIIQTMQLAGQNSEAIKRLKTCSDKYPENVDLLILLINHNLDTKSYETAKKNLEKALEIEPSNELLQFTMGSILDAEGQQDKAEKYYLEALKINEEYFAPYYSLGVLYFNKGADLNNHANSLEDDSKYKALIAEANETFARAQIYLEKAEKLNPTNQLVLQALKSLYLAQRDKTNYERVKKLLAK